MARKAASAPVPHTEEFTISRRPGWAFMGEIKVQIECDPLASVWVKLGLAAKVAFQSGASLDGARLDGASLDGARLDGASLVGARLDGASLVGASLDGARLDGASLDGARLDGASLVGATIRGEKVSRIFAIASRIEDPYVFHGYELADGGVKIQAGCRWFSLSDYRTHVLDAYPDSDKASETLAILDYIEGRATALGIALEPAQEPAAA